MKLKSGQNNLFRGLNGPRKEVKGTCGSHLKKMKKKNKSKVSDDRQKGVERRIFFLFFFS